ncbi:MAG TPA: cytochrome c peroxidase [Usitatibacter sp.]|jgi:cytochrome c peroxidase|nr:cytochrome c peroxidase [Usitatibacter sp.]
MTRIALPHRTGKGLLALAFLALPALPAPASDELDAQVAAALVHAGFTGTIQSQFVPLLGRPVNPQLADLGRLLWFDRSGGLHDDNTCGGCHSPSRAFGDTQSMAIGIQNNNIVGPDRKGPRNQRRTPFASNTPFYPNMMWNGRFAVTSGDPFDNSLGFVFPFPEGTTRFPANDPIVTHLSIAQAHMPPTELVEVAGFTCTAGTIGPEFDPFDDGMGACLPAADATGTRNDPIRAVVLQRLNGTPEYRRLFGALFPAVAAGAPIDFSMFARAIAEFEFTLIFADAPVDRFARGDRKAMSEQQKRGALVFFGKGQCVQCHAVSGESNEMFSDFRMHVIGVPQIAPAFGVGRGNVIFDGPNRDEDFGLEQVTGNAADRYKFRSSPLRNAALQRGFFHNGAMTRIEDAIRHHLDVFASARSYDAKKAGVDADLRLRLGPIEPVLARVDPLLRAPIALTGGEFEALVAFVRDALLDERAGRKNLCPLAPASVPSGYPTLVFEECN